MDAGEEALETAGSAAILFTGGAGDLGLEVESEAADVAVVGGDGNSGVKRVADAAASFAW